MSEEYARTLTAVARILCLPLVSPDGILTWTRKVPEDEVLILGIPAREPSKVSWTVAFLTKCVPLTVTTWPAKTDVRLRVIDGARTVLALTVGMGRATSESIAIAAPTMRARRRRWEGRPDAREADARSHGR